MEDRRRSSSHGRERTEERSHHHRHSKHHKKSSRDDNDDHRRKSKKHSRSKDREHKSDKDVKVEEEDEGWTVVDEDTTCAKDPVVEDSRKRRSEDLAVASTTAIDRDLGFEAWKHINRLAPVRVQEDEELRQKRIKIRENGQVQLLDKKFVDHLAEMHPTSGLHELCTRLNWPPPNMSLAFECGPPMGRMYIFKAVVNCQTYQPAVAVDNKKDAKANAAWFALQELGFIKKDPANPL